MFTCNRKFILLVATVLLGGVFFAFFSRPHEPSYQGKNLSEWVEKCATASTMSQPRENEVAADAIRHIGTNAIPFLMEWIQYVQPLGKNKRLKALNKALHWLHLNLGSENDWTIIDKEFQRAQGTIIAIAALGADAKVAVPELNRLLNLPETNQGAGRAARSLANMGNLGLPPLVAALTNANPEVSQRAALQLESLGTNAQPIIPILIQTLRDKDLIMVFGAFRSLRKINADSKLVVSVLVEKLQYPNPTDRATAAYYLSEYREEARSAVPTLISRLKDPDSNVCFQVTKALRIIAPEVLTNALTR